MVSRDGQLAFVGDDRGSLTQVSIVGEMEPLVIQLPLAEKESDLAPLRFLPTPVDRTIDPSPPVIARSTPSPFPTSATEEEELSTLRRSLEYSEASLQHMRKTVEELEGTVTSLKRLLLLRESARKSKEDGTANTDKGPRNDALLP